MSMLKNKKAVTTTAEEEIQKNTEEVIKLLDSVGAAGTELRTYIRQAQRLKDGLADLAEEKVDTRATRRAQRELNATPALDALLDKIQELEKELEEAEKAPANLTDLSLRAYGRRLNRIQTSLEGVKGILSSVAADIKSAEDEADAEKKPAAPAESEFTVNTTDPSGQMSARLLALQLFPEYKNAGYPPLKTADGKPVSFAIGIPRGDGSIRFIITDPAVTRPEDMPDLVAGYVQKRAFTPYEGVDGLVAKELMLLAHTKKPW